MIGDFTKKRIFTTVRIWAFYQAGATLKAHTQFQSHLSATIISFYLWSQLDVPLYKEKPTVSFSNGTTVHCKRAVRHESSDRGAASFSLANKRSISSQHTGHCLLP